MSLNVPYLEYPDPCPSHCIKTSWATHSNTEESKSQFCYSLYPYAYGKFLFAIGMAISQYQSQFLSLTLRLPLGVIREQGEWPLRPKPREQGAWPKIRKGAGSSKIWKGELGGAKNWENEARSKRNYRGSRRKIKKEQGAKRDEKW